MVLFKQWGIIQGLATSCALIVRFRHYIKVWQWSQEEVKIALKIYRGQLIPPKPPRYLQDKRKFLNIIQAQYPFSWSKSGLAGAGYSIISRRDTLHWKWNFDLIGARSWDFYLSVGCGQFTHHAHQRGIDRWLIDDMRWERNLIYKMKGEWRLHALAGCVPSLQRISSWNYTWPLTGGSYRPIAAPPLTNPRNSNSPKPKWHSNLQKRNRLRPAGNTQPADLLCCEVPSRANALRFCCQIE